MARPLHALAFLVFASSISGRGHAANIRNPTLVTALEAKILIYVSPIGETVRAQGFDIGMELQADTGFNQADYYTFWVFDALRPSAGSVTIGWFAVNKHTADVWEIDPDKRLTSRELRGVQALVRREHGIDSATVAEYRAKPFSRGGRPPGG